MTPSKSTATIEPAWRRHANTASRTRSTRPRPGWVRRTAVALAIALVGACVSAVDARPASAGSPRCLGWDFFVDGFRPDPDYKWIQAAVAEDQYHRKGGNDGTWWCTMRQGDSNPAVALLQNTLNACYRNIIGPPLVPDGVFGPKTRAALVAAQRHHGLAADGIYGPNTALAIKWVGMAKTPFGMVEACMPLTVFRHQQPH